MKNEIVSFNESVPEMSKLLEIDGADLELVTGGLSASRVADCPKLTSCDVYTRCTVDVSV